MSKLQYILTAALTTIGLTAEAADYIKLHCAQEYALHCVSDDQLKERPYHCLRDLKSKWGANCSKAFILYDAELSYYYGPCAKDPANTCMHHEPGTGTLGPCLHERMSQLSAECAAHLKKPWNEKFRDMNLDFEIPCAEDMKNLCPQVVRGEMRLISCMMKNFALVKAKDCRAALKPGH